MRARIVSCFRLGTRAGHSHRKKSSILQRENKLSSPGSRGALESPCVCVSLAVPSMGQNRRNLPGRAPPEMYDTFHKVGFEAAAANLDRAFIAARCQPVEPFNWAPVNSEVTTPAW